MESSWKMKNFLEISGNAHGISSGFPVLGGLMMSKAPRRCPGGTTTQLVYPVGRGLQHWLGLPRYLHQLLLRLRRHFLA